MWDFRSKDARLLASVMERSARLQIFLRTFFDVQCSSEMLGHIGQIGQSTDCKRLESWPSSSSSFCFSAISSPQLGVQSQHYRPSTEITSVEKPAMLMVAILAITNIKCNTLLYTTRFIQAAGTQCQGRPGTIYKSVWLYFIVLKLVYWALTSSQWILINWLRETGIEDFSMFGKLKSDTQGNSLGCWETF